MRTLVIITSFISLVYTLNIFNWTNNFEDYKKSIMITYRCIPRSSMDSVCYKTDQALFKDYVISHYGPPFIVLATPVLYFLYKKVKKPSRRLN